MYRPQVYAKTKKGKTIINPEYKTFLRNEIGMTEEERNEWYLLGVPLTRQREGAIVGFRDALTFITEPVGENGNGK